MKLSVKFVIALLLVLAAGLGGAAWWLSNMHAQHVLAHAQTRAFSVLSFGEACRQYTRETLSPAVREHVKPLIFEADSATFVARGTFEALRQRLPAYTFREAALNPLNLDNQADAAEEKLIRRFQDDPSLKELSGFTEDGATFFVARPIVVTKNCLQCHASPASAPPELTERYGDTHGYGWQDGDSTSAIIVTVPAEDIHTEQLRELRSVAQIFGILALVLAVVIFFLFERLVARRLRRLGTMMGRVADNPVRDTRIDDSARDELGGMAQAFNHMAQALRESQQNLEQRVAQRTTDLAHANSALEREIKIRQQAESTIQSTAQELARSNAELVQFASVASHDLQEPLRMVSSYVQLLAQRYQGQLDDKAQRWINFAVEGSLRMKQLINDLLELSRVGSRGKTFMPTDANALVATALVNLQQAINDSGAVVTHDQLPVVNGDASQLTQVFQNLIGNALKYRGPDTPTIHVGVRDLGEAWEFSVRDNGIGIDPQYHERIFLIFQRLHTREDYPGTGIGLALCKKVIDRHGGRIWVESQPGQGATFRFTLPKTPIPKKATTP